MKRLLALACATLVTTGAFAQDDQFRDVPKGHWAFDAILNLKREGLLKGYPDGTFKGSRPATRYEMAAMIEGTFGYLKGITDNIQRQMDSVKVPPSDRDPLVTRADLNSMLRSIEELRAQINGMKGWGAEIENLKSRYGAIGDGIADLRRQLDGLKSETKKIGT